MTARHHVDMLRTRTSPPPQDLVVLLDEAGRPAGSAPVSSAHSGAGRHHLGLAAYLFDDRGRLLVLRRAFSQPSPGTWTALVTGHPAPGERLCDAVARSARRAVALPASDARVVLPRVRHRSSTPRWTENESTAVVVARVPRRVITADPTLYDDAGWTDWDTYRSDLVQGRLRVPARDRELIAVVDARGPDESFWAHASARSRAPRAP